MNVRFVAFCMGLVACAPALPPPDGSERKLLQSDQERDSAFQKAATGYTSDGQSKSTPMVKLGEPMRVDGGKCYLVVVRFHAADLTSAAREHGIDFSVDLNTPSITTTSENSTTSSINPDFQGEKGGTVVGQGAWADAGCVDRPVFLIPSFNVHYSAVDRDVSSSNATVQIYSRPATASETQNATDVAGYHHDQGVSVGIGRCEDCKRQFHDCVERGGFENACRRTFYDCAGDDSNTCAAPR